MVVLALGAFLTFGPAAASAHTLGPGVVSMNYQTRLWSVTPQPAGVRISVVDDGLHVIASNDTTTPLVIDGYAGEPYLKVDRIGAWENIHSPATYLNRTFTPGSVPANANAAAPPVWRRVSRSDSVMWHDHRLHWMGTSPPAQVQVHPGSYNLISMWQITGHYGGHRVRAVGSLAWVPARSPVGWLLVLGLAAIGACAVVVMVKRPRWTMALLTVLAGLDLARGLDLVEGRGGPLVTRLQCLPWRGLPELGVIVVLLGAAAAAGRCRQMASAYLACFGAVAVLVMDGAVSLPALWQSQLLARHPWWLERALIALSIGVAVGILAGSVMTLRRRGRGLRTGRVIATAATTALVAGCGGAGGASGPPVRIDTSRLTGLGQVLTDSQGHVLYMFAPDHRRAVTCSELCQGSWPPVTVRKGQRVEAAGAAMGSLIATTPNPQGGPPVVTYDGWPLYSYVGDVTAGTASGQALNLNGGLWYVLAPNGTVIKKVFRA